MKDFVRSLRPTPLALASLLTLGACGGGSGGTETPATVITTKFTGTAATGAAMSNATLQVKCAAGTASGTTAVDGSYTLELSNATLPCVLKAMSSDSKTVLHSVANPDGGTTQVIQINPVTELLVARLAGQAAAAFFTGFDATASAKITAASIATSVTAVLGTLKDGGVDLSALGNPLTATLVPATQQAPGNAYDQALDLLAAKLTQAGTTLQQFSAQVVASANPDATPNPTPGAGPTMAVPAALLLRPAHADCAALRSGAYRFIDLTYGQEGINAKVAQVDAPTLTVTWPDASLEQGVSEGGCAFRFDGGRVRLVVSPAGVGVFTSLNNGNVQTLGIIFPEQVHAMASLAGTWNSMSFERIESDATHWQNHFGRLDTAADGRIVAQYRCEGLASCTVRADSKATHLLPNATGGFDVVLSPTGSSVPRAFVYRPASGDPMMVFVTTDGFGFATLEKPLPLRAVNDAWANWNISANWTGFPNPSFTDSAFKVSAVDTVAQSYVRLNTINGVAQTFSVNKPRVGMAYSPAGSTTNNSNQVVNLSELFLLPLPGAGITAFGRSTTDTTRSQGFFGLAVSKP